MALAAVQTLAVQGVTMQGRPVPHTNAHRVAHAFGDGMLPPTIDLAQTHACA